MPITGTQHVFTADNIKTAPDESGVYALFKTGKLVYVGSATTSIRSRLHRHQNGEEGECTKSATDYACETTGSPQVRERELLQEYKDDKGTLPDCNDVMP